MTTNVISIKTRKMFAQPARRRAAKIPEDIIFGLGVFLTVILSDGIFAAAYGGLASFKIFMTVIMVGCSIGVAMYLRSISPTVLSLGREESPRAPSKVVTRMKDAA